MYQNGNADRTPEVLGRMLGVFLLQGGFILVDCILWSLAVGKGLIPGLIAGAIIGGAFGLFIGLSSYTRTAAYGSSMMFGPIWTVLAVLAMMVWGVRIIIT